MKNSLTLTMLPTQLEMASRRLVMLLKMEPRQLVITSMITDNKLPMVLRELITSLNNTLNSSKLLSKSALLSSKMMKNSSTSAACSTMVFTSTRISRPRITVVS